MDFFSPKSTPGAYLRNVTYDNSTPSSWFRNRERSLILFVAIFFAAVAAHGLTSAFTFQGRLTDNGIGANGSYDIQLKLYDTFSPGSGTQIGGTLTFSGVAVMNGVFTVQPDFTPNAFQGADRFVEVAVKPAGSGTAFNVLSP